MNLHRTFKLAKRKTKRLIRKTIRYGKRLGRRLSGMRYGGYSANPGGSGYGSQNGYDGRTGSRGNRGVWSDRKIYTCYIAGVTLLCLLLAQIRPGGEFRWWVYRLFNHETINKGVEYDVAAAAGSSEVGQFLTYYRFQKFGKTDPNEIDPNAPMIALTFDDGPSPESTQRILDVLSANYSHATFFVVGRQAATYPDMVKAISAAGCELGNHTYDHANLTELSDEDVEKQIEDVNLYVRHATGDDTTVIRPPYGAYNDQVMRLLNKPVILWDVDSEDWSSRNAWTICDKVLSEVQDGDIVLMHDIYDSTAEAVEILVPKLKEQGYQIVSVSEMALYKGKTLELGKAYGKLGE